MNSSINVYLKLKPGNQVGSLIKDFNQLLKQKRVLSRYHIYPFLNSHPIHITLYLTSYKQQQITEIMKQTQLLAKRQKKIPISTRQFIASDNGYVMLSVDGSKQLQQLSNITLNVLARLRDKKALIPAWAARDKKRSETFNHWGSPNVLSYFHPHVSIFDPEHLSQKQRVRLYAKLQRLINQFSKDHQITIDATAYAIGVGLADAQGQIVKELGAFELS
jgi:hypothetical protein